MVVIKSSPSHDCCVFPPINHEGLHNPSQYNHQNQVTPEPSSSFSPSDDTADCPSSFLPPCSRFRLHHNFSWWFGIGFEVLRSKVIGIVSSVQNSAASRGLVWPFASLSGVMTVVFLSLLYFRLRRQQRRLEGSLDHLMLLIKEKDEKIIHLLHQIAQMNKVLLARAPK